MNHTSNCVVLEAAIKRKSRYPRKEVISKKSKKCEDQNKVPLSNGKKIDENNTVCISFPAKSFLFESRYTLFMEWFTAIILVTVITSHYFNYLEREEADWGKITDVPPMPEK